MTELIIEAMLERFESNPVLKCVGFGGSAQELGSLLDRICDYFEGV